MTTKTKLLLAVVVVAALAVTAGLASLIVGVGDDTPTAAKNGQPGSTDPGVTASADPARSPDEIGQAFLRDWVDQGRVVRRDQGGDTVSEGQAYGMLVAVALGDEKSFEQIWSWTKDNLVRDDGLLAWRWDKGAVVDDMPASDADVDAARALVLAGQKFDDTAYTEAGTTLGADVLDTMTAQTDVGLILLPGPWAKTSAPWTYNPSYASPASFEMLAKATGDPRWSELVTGSRAVTTTILTDTALPSDWAQVEQSGAVNPLPSADGTSGTVQYSYDAARLGLRYAESCDPADVALAARMAPTLQRYEEPPMQLDLGGQATGTDKSPLAYAARAAAEAAAGSRDEAEADLLQADRLAQSTPTYYGSAWSALAALQLDGNALDACSPLAVSS